MGFGLTGGLGDAFSSIAKNIRGFDDQKKADEERALKMALMQTQNAGAVDDLKQRPIDRNIAAVERAQTAGRLAHDQSVGDVERQRVADERAKHENAWKEMAASQDPFVRAQGLAAMAGIDAGPSKATEDYKFGHAQNLAGANDKNQRDVANIYANATHPQIKDPSDILGELLKSGINSGMVTDQNQISDYLDSVMGSLNKFRAKPIHAADNPDAPGVGGAVDPAAKTRQVIGGLDRIIQGTKGNFAAAKAMVEKDRQSGEYDVDAVLRALEQKQRDSIMSAASNRGGPR